MFWVDLDWWDYLMPNMKKKNESASNKQERKLMCLTKTLDRKKLRDRIYCNALITNKAKGAKWESDKSVDPKCNFLVLHDIYLNIAYSISQCVLSLSHSHTLRMCNIFLIFWIARMSVAVSRFLLFCARFLPSPILFSMRCSCLSLSCFSIQYHFILVVFRHLRFSCKRYIV